MPPFRLAGVTSPISPAATAMAWATCEPRDIDVMFKRATLPIEGNASPRNPSVEILTNKKDNVMSVPLAAVTTRNPNDLAEDEEKKEQQGPGSTSNRAVVDDKKEQAKKKEDKVVIFVNEKGTAKMIEVKTGISDYDNIEITSELKDSTQVVIGPFLAVSKRLKDGDKVREKPKEDKDKSKSE